MIKLIIVTVLAATALVLAWCLGRVLMTMLAEAHVWL